jgi:hypothetical protein
MAAAAVATNFVDEYVGAIRIARDSINWVFFPGQIIQGYSDEEDEEDDLLSYYRIIDINDGLASIVPIEYYESDTLMHQTLPPPMWPDTVQLGESNYYPVNNPTSLKPSLNTNKQELDLMIAYAPDRADKIISNYAVEYSGTTRDILGIFRSYENKVYCLLDVDRKYKLWELEITLFGRLVRRDNADERYHDDVFDEFVSRSDNSGASLDDTARRRPFGRARMRSMRRLADGESLNTRVENLEERMERIEGRLNSETPEDDETGAPDADSLPSLSIRF